MLGREPGYWTPERVALIKEHFVAVAIMAPSDIWSPKRKNLSLDEQLFRLVYAKGEYYDNAVIAMTPGGKRLARRAGQNYVDPQAAHAEWRQLPAAERKPGAVTLADLVADPQAPPLPGIRPPAGGLIARVFLRALARNASGELRHTVPDDFPASRQHSFQAARAPNREAARDFLWLTRDEWQYLLPEDLKVGDRFPLPAKVRDRICLMHLTDGVRNLAPVWYASAIRREDLFLIVEESSTARVRLRLEGSVLLANDPNLAKSSLGYDVRLLGFLTFDRAKGVFDRFDIGALGDFWDVQDMNTTGARPGRAPLGIAFELARAEVPAERVPPGAYWYCDYFKNKYPK